MTVSSYQQLVATRPERQAALRKIYGLPCHPTCIEARMTEQWVEERLDEDERVQRQHELSAAILKKSQKVAAALYKRQPPTHKVDWQSEDGIPRGMYMSEPLWPLTYVVDETGSIVYLYYLARSYMCSGALIHPERMAGAGDAYIEADGQWLTSSRPIDASNSHLEIILQALEELDE